MLCNNYEIETILKSLNTIMDANKSNSAIALKLTDMVVESRRDRIQCISQESIFSCFKECSEIVDKCYPIKDRLEEFSRILEGLLK
jgi:hypothetical protein